PAHTAETVSQDWPALKAELTAIFKSRNRAEWIELFAGSDACVTPILTLSEAAEHPHNRARRAFIEVGGLLQNAPAPRFSRTAPAHPRPPAKTGSDTQTVLADWGIDPSATAKF
ncbi:MAG: alpha-methylacyl-CoA racemase, partial [Gammaproteobacteria bacterium]|nr:alpha-methylacyl-CoA racemase [Gammaproteobacteria bacterium]